MSSLAQTLWDFLSFQTFVSPYALIVFYYLGALVMPLATWGLMVWARRRAQVLGDAYEFARGLALDRLSPRQRALVIALALGAFVFMELLWRMMFEFLIAYLQMRDALLQLSQVPGAP
jgi:hypothetical protein